MRASIDKLKADFWDVAAICNNHFLSLHTSSVCRLVSCVKNQAIPKTLWVVLAAELIKLYKIRYMKIVSRKCSFSCWNDCVGQSYADWISRLCFLFSLRYSVVDHAHGAVSQDHGSADYNSWTEQHLGECLLIQLKLLLEEPLQERLPLPPRLEPACLFMKFVFPTLCQNPSVSVLLCTSSPTASQSESKSRFYKISAKCEQACSAWKKSNCVNKVLSLGLWYCSDRRTDLGEYYADTIKALLASVLAA